MYDDPTRRRLAEELSSAFLEPGAWSQARLSEAGGGRLDRWPDWLPALAFSAASEFRAAPIDQPHRLVAHIEWFLLRRVASAQEASPPRVLRDLTVLDSPGVKGRRLRHAWPIAAVESVAELADRLELSPGLLEWLADPRSLERRVSAERLRNYRYAIVPRRHGLPRVIEAPKARLKEVQRWILREILDHVPAHDAAHGFTSGRSVLSNARVHVGQAAVLGLDLVDFFASVSAGRVFGIFATLGYPRRVAHLLTGLCTNVAPPFVLDAVAPATDPRCVNERYRLGRRLAIPHLPQGAATSPALANLVAFGLDRRLAGLARARGLAYSRYADDLTFSGTDRLRRSRRWLEDQVAAIVREEGFVLHAEKSRLRTAASRQSVCGVVVNVAPNVGRREYDQLKAILHNAARFGPASQNRAGVADFEAHLRGRIAWVGSLNPARGETLLRRLAAIDWSGT